MVGQSVIGPLDEGAAVLEYPPGQEQAELLQCGFVVFGERAGIGAGRARVRGVRQCDLDHRCQRDQGRIAVSVEREQRALATGYGLDQRVAAKLELSADAGQFRPTEVARARRAFQAGLAREARRRMRIRERKEDAPQANSIQTSSRLNAFPIGDLPRVVVNAVCDSMALLMPPSIVLRGRPGGRQSLLPS